MKNTKTKAKAPPNFMLIFIAKNRNNKFKGKEMKNVRPKINQYTPRNPPSENNVKVHATNNDESRLVEI